MGGHLPIEREDGAGRHQRPQVIERASVAKPELDHGAVDAGNELDGAIETAPLRFEAPDETIKTAHAR